jgi:hypothetical protein
MRPARFYAVDFEISPFSCAACQNGLLGLRRTRSGFAGNQKTAPAMPLRVNVYIIFHNSCLTQVLMDDSIRCRMLAERCYSVSFLDLAFRAYFDRDAE